MDFWLEIHALSILGPRYLSCMSLLAELVPGVKLPVSAEGFSSMGGPPSPMPMCSFFHFSRCVSLPVKNNDDTDLPIPGGQRNRDSRHWRRQEKS
ncbi:hypothetical protein LB506_010238 [Fusarium annulatum]|nr:hypothetical protein LB506_010238 [Fusarium annulatum]